MPGPWASQNAGGGSGPGPIGPPGTPGATWRTGSGAPSDNLGANNDLYLDVDTGDVYKRVSGTYLLITNINGEDSVTGGYQVVAFSTTPTIDVSLGRTIDMTLTGPLAVLSFAGGVEGDRIVLRLRQDGVGGRALNNFGSMVRIADEVATVVLSSAPGVTDILGLVYHAGDDKYDVVAYSSGLG